MTSSKVVLYAEDDENDVFLMQRAFSKLQISAPLQTVSDGKETISYLSGTAPYNNREKYPQPQLLLMDLSMPGKHGLEVLKWMKEEPSLADLPVLVLSSSNQESDIHRAYQLGANGYIIKPGDPKELLNVVRNIQEYWLADKRPPGTFLDFSGLLIVPAPKAPGTNM
jgi:CheY-like chemotaxis protein